MAEAELPNPRELEEIKGKKFTRTAALVTAVFAVVLAIASLGGNHAMKEMLLAQQQASDQWAYYQAKSIREHLYKSQKMMLENELVAAVSELSSPECGGKSQGLHQRLLETRNRSSQMIRRKSSRKPESWRRNGT